MVNPDIEKKVKWGDNCPVCGAIKSIIAGVNVADRKQILVCYKCRAVFPHS